MYLTSDHIFLLQTIIEKVVKKNRKRLFCAFADFKKAYDTVDRKILLQQLQSIGINGVFYKNIAADDLVLLSTSGSGLQNCLTKLQNFSKAKHLTINTEKTKTMIFNYSGKL